MIAEGIYTKISSDSGITDRLASYNFTTGVSSPAIFTIDVIPEDSGYPAIIIDEDGGISEGSFGFKGANTYCTVRLYDDKDRTSLVVKDIAWDLYKLLDRSEITFPAGSGFYSAWVIASPPRKLSDIDGFPGYAIDLTINIFEE